MKNLGKILILLCLIPLSMIAREVAKVQANVDASNIQRGEMVTYELMIDGDNIVRPVISTLCNVPIISTGSQTSIQLINGTMTKSYIFTYKFIPEETCVIKPIGVEIDSRIVRSKSVKVNVSNLLIRKDSPFDLILKSDKSKVFVGEPFEVKLLFKQRDGAEAIDSEFIAPNFQGFWIKEESKASRYKEDGYTITEKKYKLAAQRIGELKISPAQMRIAYRTHKRDPWAGIISRIKWRSYYSNELNIGVEVIPNGMSLVGDFSITAEIDKSSIKANEAVNVNIRVQGYGNLEDIESFKPSIDGVNVFDEKIKIVDGVLMQTMAFVSDGDFTVPSFELRFFNPKTKEVQTIKTKPYSIHVKGSQKKSESLIIKKDETMSSDAKVTSSSLNFTLSTLQSIIIFVGGLFLGILIMLISPFKKSQKIKPLNIKDEKVLLIKLLPYKDDKEVQEILDILEGNIYSSQKETLNKKKIKELIKRYSIS